MCLMWYW